ncbi:MAG: NAD(P)-binding domain-containing protein [Candidatus Sulfotelmatobacter sp.]|jgi:thioredoxin reductase
MSDIVIVGTGPYGLSIAAHLRKLGLSFRIFGRPMDSWLAHMPKGMLLKSDGFASNISDPEGQLTLKKYCAERGIPYADTGIPVRLDTFSSYGLTFRERMVPELEEKMVVSIERSSEGYQLLLDDGERVLAGAVVLAVGITHFEHVPESLAHLPAEFLSHSGRYHEVEQFRGRNVVVVGGGASALDWAGLLHEAGVPVQLVARQTALKFHGRPSGKKRSLWERMQRPQSGIGPGWRARFYANAPGAFHYLPENLRLEIVRRTLGPSGGWFIRDTVMNNVPLMLGYTPQGAEVRDGKVHLHLRGQDGTQREVVADHIISATGYKVDLERLTFLSSEIRSKLKSVASTPVLSSGYESSVPGLYFVGVAAANSFGPVMRFAFGADFAARTVSRALAKSGVREPVRASIPGVVRATKKEDGKALASSAGD